MPAHIRKRGRYWYLVDGDTYRSLHTSKRGEAEYLLKLHIQNKLGIVTTPMIGAWYEQWIAGKVEPLYRRSQIRDYRQHWTAYILPEFRDMPLANLRTSHIEPFRLSLIQRVSVKTARNVIDGSFRACYRDARAHYEELQGRDPFLDIHWPRRQQERPDPFVEDQPDCILRWFGQYEPFYYAWVLTQFKTGMRPSETSGLFKTDVSVANRELNITKSRHLGSSAGTKTSKSSRTIIVTDEVMDAIRVLSSWTEPSQYLFLNKINQPLDAGQWARTYWKRCLDACGIRYRKFYATRHTFITRKVQEGYSMKAIADYCGTSAAMIEANYCGRLSLDGQAQVLEPGLREMK